MPIPITPKWLLARLYAGCLQSTTQHFANEREKTQKALQNNSPDHHAPLSSTLMFIILYK
eukprot:scaffold427_cov103-Alexandrium_tamarense.AAC.20